MVYVDIIIDEKFSILRGYGKTDFVYLIRFIILMMYKSLLLLSKRTFHIYYEFS